MNKFQFSFMKDNVSYSPKEKYINAESLAEAAVLAKAFVKDNPIAWFTQEGDPDLIILTGLVDGGFVSGIFQFDTLNPKFL